MEDPVWFALRNTTYATSRRYLLANSTSITFQHAEATSWLLFCNALSVIGEMIVSHSGMTAIQALTIMTFHAMGLAGLCVEYPMIKYAVQLAHAKELQRESLASWGLSSADLLTRNWLWWTISVIDKQMSIQSGRPSSILDDDISTPIPTTAPPGSSIDVKVVTLIIRHAQICFRVMDRIMPVKASKQGFDRPYETIRDIQEQLEGLLQDMPSSIDGNTTSSAALSAN
ncbi:uncharacterized protein PV06_09366 [Exophiala oligosperma]|uniref:Xylanolytic transcriptional activator regulatory domain-containing protein n=1 Tax=Exophiala oligosperma TaxID=215243 RepID=A0A0D2D7L5_9EURO|nr:uncharacterized protein PV06_09366 [Exophiala oligosperma]KIW38395.1 hypothetical protein PV06_09366 [Exophiala oligosperma]